MEFSNQTFKKGYNLNVPLENQPFKSTAILQ